MQIFAELLPPLMIYASVENPRAVQCLRARGTSASERLATRFELLLWGAAKRDYLTPAPFWQFLRFLLLCAQRVFQLS